MRRHRRCISSTAVAGLGALAVIAAAPPPEVGLPPAVHDVRLAAAPALGAIPAAFLRNQFQYCEVICPYVVEGAVTVPIAAAQIPATFLGAVQTTGSLLKSIGIAAASVTGPANAAAGPIIENDLSLVLPKAQNALQVAVVQAINVGTTVLRPGEFLPAVDTARTRIVAALDQPVGAPVGPTGARNVLQVVAVESINVVSAVVFQAGELVVLGVVQTAHVVAQELADTGAPGAALAAGAAQANEVAAAAGGRVVTAVDTAVTNIRSALKDPFPTSTAGPTAGPTDRPADPTVAKRPATGARHDEQPGVDDTAASRRADDTGKPSESRGTNYRSGHEADPDDSAEHPATAHRATESHVTDRHSEGQSTDAD